MASNEDLIGLENRLRAEMKQGSDRLAAQIVGLSGRVGEVRAITDGQAVDIVALSDKLDGLGQRLGGVEQRLGGVEQRLGTMDEKLDSILAALKPRPNGGPA